jgi:RepB plasmid partitioning protein/ParB-like nuclease domain
MAKKVSIAFEPQGLTVPLNDILPLKPLKFSIHSSSKFQQVLASVREMGIVEPLVIFSQNSKAGTYLLLDGHLRLEVLKEIGETHARCLVATDDETYTYNKRVNRMATIQEHTMILNATKNGISEERIAKVLRLDVVSIRQKRDLLTGICKEAVEVLKTRHVSLGAFFYLRKMKPMRQIEVAELLTACGNYSVPYVKALFAATPPEMLVDPEKYKPIQGLTPEQTAKMEKEMENLQRDLNQIEDSHGNQVLNLVLARGYLAKLLGNSRVVRYLTQHHTDILKELQTISEGSTLES